MSAVWAAKAAMKGSASSSTPSLWVLPFEPIDNSPLGPAAVLRLTPASPSARFQGVYEPNNCSAWTAGPRVRREAVRPERSSSRPQAHLRRR